MAKILIVEDEFWHYYPLKLLLEREGHVIEVAERGEHARTLLNNPAYLEDLHLIILDLGLPTVDADKILAEIEHSNPEVWNRLMKIPIIIISIHAESEVVAHIQEICSNIEKVYTKPASLNEILRSVTTLLKEKVAQKVD